MQYFDLNIPYLESEKSISEKSVKKQTRLKQIVKLMEFGYCGIAYNRTIKGVMSESDRCTISPFPLNSLLNHSPSLCANVSFHRRLLGVAQNFAFRQYTRLTMLVETSAQASALNSGNPILKTYDLIAVIPMNQNSFDLACQSSQVDLISIDFGEKLPFRLKLPMVKAAIARGVYFEIMYSSLMQDIQVRRQMISNAKLLVEWTRGKNLIVSSAAPSVLELRGPTDVVNLLSMLGLTNEFAKATISKNCRLLMANALRKKQFHKEAIRVEEMPPVVQTDPKEPWLVDHIDWDPLSSGEGDLLLDDMAKAFAASGKVSQSVKGLNFPLLSDSVQSQGLQVNDFGTEGKLSSCANYTAFIPTTKDIEVPKKTEKLQNEPTSFCSLILDKQENTGEDLKQEVLPDIPMTSTGVEGFSNSSTSILQELKITDAPETFTSLLRLHEENHVSISNSLKEITSRSDDLDVGCIAGSITEVLTTSESPNHDGAQIHHLQLASGELNGEDARISTEMQFCDQSGLLLYPDITPGVSLPEVTEDPVADEKSSLHARNTMNMDSVIERNSNNGLLHGDRQLLEEVGGRKEHHSEVDKDTEKVIDANAMILEGPFHQEKDGNDLLRTKSMLFDDLMTERRKQVQEIGTKSKRRKKGVASRFPFKRLLQVQFKKNWRTRMYNSKKRE